MKKVHVLPRLKKGAVVPQTDAVGEWFPQDREIFRKVAESLDYVAPDNAEDISSVPTMWARPLITEMALHDDSHPLHNDVYEQWQGMLAALALAKINQYPIKVQLVDISTIDSDFARSLNILKPDFQENSLYDLASGDRNPWREVYVFLWDGKPVGMTSPSTLVVSSEEGDWGWLPWYRNENGECKLRPPHGFLSDYEKVLLADWLSKFDNGITSANTNNSFAVQRIRRLTERFIDSLHAPKIDCVKTIFTPSSEAYFGLPIDRGCLKVLDFPVEAIRLTGILSSQVTANGDRLPIEFVVPNLDNYGVFIDDLYFVKGTNPLPTGLYSKSDYSLQIEGEENILPLLPLKSDFVELFNVEELCQRISFSSQVVEDGKNIKVTVNLPVAQSQPDIVLSKTYRLNSGNIVENLPVVEVWPDFRADGWSAYYAFYCDLDYINQQRKTFKVAFPGVAQSYDVKAEQGDGLLEITALESFPEYVECLFPSDATPIGIIPLDPPRFIDRRQSWKVGVDFGTSFTNVWFRNLGNADGVPSPLDLKSVNLYQITDSPLAGRTDSLYEYFIADIRNREDPLPLATVLTTKGENRSRTKSGQSDEPLIDGRIYIPDYQKEGGIAPEPFIHADLKWDVGSRRYEELFLENLILYISAAAVSEGVTSLQWGLSFPSAFSEDDLTRYSDAWFRLTQKVAGKTGLQSQLVAQDSGGSFLTESVAVARYFKDVVKSNLTHAACIDMGGGTSDISIWGTVQGKVEILHQCSVQFAGRNVFSQFLSINKSLLKSFAQGDLEEESLEGVDSWDRADGGTFYAKLDVLLRKDNQSALARKLDGTQDQTLRGLKFLIALSFSGLFYYVGTILGSLSEAEDESQKLTRKRITPVFMAGNGARFLNWLAVLGDYNNSSAKLNVLLSRMLSAGSGFQSDIEKTVLSSRPKDEVACGLVAKSQFGAEITDIESWESDYLIAGERYSFLGNSHEPFSKFELSDRQSRFIEKLRTLSMVSDDGSRIIESIPNFLHEFHLAIEQIGGVEIYPLKDYVSFSEEEYDVDQDWQINYSNLWKQVEAELPNEKDKMIDSKRIEPPFIIALKALLSVLGEKWLQGSLIDG